MEDYTKNQNNNIIGGLDAETVNALKSVQKNFNDDFMNGSSTSGFREYKESGDKTKLASVEDNLSGIATGINSASNLIDSVITPKLISYATTYITGIVMTYMTEATTSMLSFDASAIAKKAANIIPQHLLTVGEITKELLTTRESMNDELLKETENKLIEDINNKIGDSVGKVNKDIKGELEKINGTIAEISYYAQMGPVWVQSKLDLAMSKIIENCLSKIGKVRDTVNKQKEDTINNLAETKGKQMASSTNEKLKSSTKESMDEVNKKKQEALTKVKTQVINAKMKIFALIGA